MMPEELSKILSNSRADKPLIVCVGFDRLYNAAHIPGARFIGSGRDPKAIEALKDWAKTVPKDKELVIYCGCCPMKVCPNLRPAFAALREVRPAHIKILYLEDSLAKDWVNQGYPTEKGGA